MKYKIKNDEMRISELDARNGGVSFSENLYGSTDKSLIARGKRACIRKLTLGEGLMGDDTLAYVDNGRLYYGGLEITGLYLTPGEKRILKVGKFLVIFPDEVFFNLENHDDCGSMNSTYMAYGSYITVSDSLGTKLEYGTVNELPESAEEKTYCLLKEASGNLVLKQMLKGMWQNADSYIKIMAGGIGASFRTGDTVYCTGLKETVGGTYFKIGKRMKDALLIKGVLVTNGYSSSTIQLSRTVPIFDYVTVSGGRLFGVRRGTDRDGNLVCRMYGSAVGDPFNFAPEGGGLVMDLDINGMFTGLCDYLGNPVAFTENEIIEARVKGNSLIGTLVKGYGVEKGANKSIAQYGGALYYKSRAGICYYDGSYPEIIGEQASSEQASCGIAINGKYYLSAENGISVYDIKAKKWCKENACGVIAFAECKCSLYALCRDTDGDFIVLMDYDNSDSDARFYLADEGYPLVEEAVSWRLESADIGAGEFDSVCPVRIAVKMKNGGNYPICVTVAYDGEHSFAKSITSALNGTVEIPLPLRRCESFKIIIEGRGKVKLSGLQAYYRAGGKARGWK